LNNILSIDNKIDSKNNLKNEFSDFDSKSALREFKELQIISPNIIEEKLRDKIIDLKSGMKIKSKMTIGKENLMNWKFEEKLKESKFSIISFINFFYFSWIGENYWIDCE